MWKSKRTRTANMILNENKVEGFILPNLGIYYKAPVPKTEWSLKGYTYR